MEKVKNKIVNNESFLKEQYLKLNKTAKEIALENDYSKGTIYRKLKKFRIKKGRKGVNCGDKNGMWRGDEVSYDGLHDWIKVHKPKPELCEKCKEKPPYELANISGKYKRDINDFEWICRKCHMESDGRMKKLLIILHKLHLKQRRKIKGNLIQCIKCKKFKLKIYFWKDKFHWDGLSNYCIDCATQKNKKYYLKNKKRTKDNERR